AAIVGAYQSSRVRPAVFLRRHLGPQRRSRTHRRRPRAAEAPGGAELQRRQCVGSVNPQLVKTQGIEKCERKHENGKKISGICKALLQPHALWCDIPVIYPYVPNCPTAWRQALQ